MTIQAIIRTSYTVAATFTGVPTVEERKSLKASGAEFRNGQWVRTISESKVVDAADAVAAFAAA